MTARDVLDGIKGRLTGATPGPWTVDAMDAGHSRYEMNVWVATDNGDQVCDMDGLNRSRNEEHAKDDGYADAVFIAAAPTDVARLTGALEAVLGLADRADASVTPDFTGYKSSSLSTNQVRAAIENALEGA